MTFNGHNEIRKNSAFKGYSSPNGELIILKRSGKRKIKYWSIDNEGRHCVSKKPAKSGEGRCYEVINIGNGVYEKFLGGRHSHTLRNFQSGNRLN